MTCGKCGHTSGMHDERGCVALDCLCNRYIPPQGQLAVPVTVVRQQKAHQS
jgi:hypothetical protein